MNIPKRYLPIAAAALALLSLLVWRLWPRSVYAVAGITEAQVERIILSVSKFTFNSETGLEDAADYHLDSAEDPDALEEVKEILSNCRWRPSFRNWVSPKQGEPVQYSEYMARVYLVWDNGQDSQMLTIWTPDTAAADHDQYRLSNENTLAKLADYAMTNGTTDTKPILITP